MTPIFNAFEWLTRSSADPQRTSLAVRGFLTGIAPIIMIVFGITDAEFGTLADAGVNAAFTVLSAIAAVQLIWGLVRKVINKRWAAPL